MKNYKILIKYKLLKIAEIIDDFLNNPFIFYYQKTFIKLSVVLLVAILIVLRESEAPLLIESRILSFLFCKNPDGDKTIYNIGVSVIAAYIFYIFQVHIPEVKLNKSQMIKNKTIHRRLIFLLNQYIIAWNNFLNKVKGECNFYEFEYTLSGHGGGIVSKLTFKETIEELPKTFERIINGSDFSNCDIAYKELVSDSYCKIMGYLEFMNDQFPLWYDVPLVAEDYKEINKNVLLNMKRIKNRFAAIEQYNPILVEVKKHTESSEIQRLAEKL